MSAREDILARLSRATAAPDRPSAVSAEPVAGAWATRLARFAASLQSASATHAVVATPAAVPGAVAAYLAGQFLPLRIQVGESPAAAELRGSGELACHDDGLAGDGGVLVTGCLAALAEEGVVVLASGPRQAAGDAFLAATHIVIVESGQLLDGLEALWPLLRRSRLPRSVHLIRGPSRTADLGVPSRLGAHGPLRVHVILIASPYVQ